VSKVNLETSTEFQVRFSEVDSMGVVWHGNYLKFLEDGREDFGKKFGMGYLETFNTGFLIPLVNIECSYKKPLLYGETGIVITRFINSDAAKIIYEYSIYNKESKALLCTAKTVQVFLDMNHELMLTPPAHFIEWKKKLGLINDNTE
jgi:acyl-CoA thioester hydrolase